MPRKTFVNGQVLTDTDLNTYLMNQSVMTFASSAARSSAIPSPSEGMVTYLEDSNRLDVWTGSSWAVVNDNTASVPLDTVTAKGDLIVASGSAVVTRLGKGTAGQVLTAGTATLGWDTAYPAITTEGDLLVGTGAGAVTRLGIGSDGQALLSNGTTATWGAVAADSMTLISSTSLSSASTTLSSIPSSYKNLKLYIKNISVSANVRLRIRFNSDTGSNYHNWQISTADDTPDTASTYLFEMGRDIASGTSVTQFELEVTEYSSDASIKMAKGFMIASTTTPAIENYTVFGGYVNSSAINSVTIYSDDGSSVISGTALLYGVK